ncbi:hypothetical protein ES703_105058 [subsurface metagenome]
MAENLKKNPYVRERVERMNELFEKIKEDTKKPLSTIIGAFAFKYGLRNKTVMAYLSQLQQAGKIKFDRFADTVEAIA